MNPEATPIVINGVIRMKILGTKGKHVRVGISAPPDVVVDRAEVAARREFQLEGLKAAPRTKREVPRAFEKKGGRGGNVVSPANASRRRALVTD